MAKQTGSYDFTAARAAAEMADDISQHFWTKSTGGTTDIPTGSYVTEVPEEEFTDPNHVNYCSGGNLVLQSNKIRLRLAAITLAELTSNSLDFYDPNGTKKCYISSDSVIGGLHLVKKYGANYYDSSYFIDGELKLMPVVNGVPQGSVSMIAPNNDGDNIIYAETEGGTKLVDVYYDQPNDKVHGDVKGDLSLNGKLSAVNSIMVGMIEMYAGSTAPSGWLICNGDAISRTTYSALFGVIGTTYGTGNGSTTFNLPDLRGRTPIGSGTGTATNATAHSLGSKGGNEDAIIPYHRHKAYKYSSSKLASGTVGARIYDPTGSNGDSTMYTDYAGTNGNATGANMMPYATINFIIFAGI